MDNEAWGCLITLIILIPLALLFLRIQWLVDLWHWMIANWHANMSFLERLFS